MDPVSLAPLLPCAQSYRDQAGVGAGAGQGEANLKAIQDILVSVVLAPGTFQRMLLPPMGLVCMCVAWWGSPYAPGVKGFHLKKGSFLGQCRGQGGEGTQIVSRGPES